MRTHLASVHCAGRFHKAATPAFSPRATYRAAVPCITAYLGAVSVIVALEWCRTVVLVCISIVINETEYLFVLFGHLGMAKKVKCLFKSFAHFSFLFFLFHFS